MWGWEAEERLSLGKVLRDDHSYSPHFKKGHLSLCACTLVQPPRPHLWLDALFLPSFDDLLCMCACVAMEAKVQSWVLFPRYLPRPFLLFEMGSPGLPVAWNLSCRLGWMVSEPQKSTLLYLPSAVINTSPRQLA